MLLKKNLSTGVLLKNSRYNNPSYLFQVSCFTFKFKYFFTIDKTFFNIKELEMFVSYMVSVKSIKYKHLYKFDQAHFYRAHFCFRDRETGLVFNLTHTDTGLQPFCYDTTGRFSFLMLAVDVDTRTLGSIPIEKYKQLQPFATYVRDYLNNQLSPDYIT